MKEEPKPRGCNFMGMITHPQHFKENTWLEPEEITYPSGAMIRRARAKNKDTGKLQVVRCGIPDTYFSIPVRGGGFLMMDTDNNVLMFHPPKKKETK